MTYLDWRPPRIGFVPAIDYAEEVTPPAVGSQPPLPADLEVPEVELQAFVIGDLHRIMEQLAAALLHPRLEFTVAFWPAAKEVTARAVTVGDYFHHEAGQDELVIAWADDVLPPRRICCSPALMRALERVAWEDDS